MFAKKLKTDITRTMEDSSCRHIVNTGPTRFGLDFGLDSERNNETTNRSTRGPME
jgi:hypothetical protein